MTALIEEGWGAGPWGETPWGTGLAALELLTVVAVRENAVRLTFSTAPLYDRLGGPHDASDPRRFAVVPVSGTSLQDGSAARPVLPVSVAVVGLGGRALDVYLDRPMTGADAIYRASVNNLIASAGGDILPGASLLFLGLHAGEPPPTSDQSIAMRDFLIPMSVRDLEGANVPGDPTLALGRLPVDAGGDYASSTPLAAYRIRVIRRAISLLNSFAHLAPGYGADLPRDVKKPASPALIARRTAELERQIALEPETVSVTVTGSVADPRGVVVYRIRATARFGTVIIDLPQR